MKTSLVASIKVVALLGSIVLGGLLSLWHAAALGEITGEVHQLAQARALGGDCTTAKLVAAGDKVGRLLGCQARSAITGDPLDLTCTSHSSEIFAREFASAEARAQTTGAGCATVGDAPRVEELIDDAAAQLSTALRGTTTRSLCAAFKLRAAGRAAAGLLHAEATLRLRRDSGAYDKRLTNLRQELEDTFARVEARGQGACPSLADSLNVAGSMGVVAKKIARALDARDELRFAGYSLPSFPRLVVLDGDLSQAGVRAAFSSGKEALVSGAGGGVTALSGGSSIAIVPDEAGNLDVGGQPLAVGDALAQIAAAVHSNPEDWTAAQVALTGFAAVTSTDAWSANGAAILARLGGGTAALDAAPAQCEEPLPFDPAGAYCTTAAQCRLRAFSSAAAFAASQALAPTACAALRDRCQVALALDLGFELSPAGATATSQSVCARAAALCSSDGIVAAAGLGKIYRRILARCVNDTACASSADCKTGTLDWFCCTPPATPTPATPTPTTPTPTPTVSSTPFGSPSGAFLDGAIVY